jgi:integrase
VESSVRANLNRYVGPVQISHIGQDRWLGYPLWRQKTWRERVKAEKQKAEGQNGSPPSKHRQLPTRVSGVTIRTEMSIFRAIMTYAASKKFISEGQMFKGKLPLDKVRREEFTPEEYRKLHTFARGWIKKVRKPVHVWNRTIVYNFVLIMCNTGMRPPGFPRGLMCISWPNKWELPCR